MEYPWWRRTLGLCFLGALAVTGVLFPWEKAQFGGAFISAPLNFILALAPLVFGATMAFYFIVYALKVDYTKNPRRKIFLGIWILLLAFLTVLICYGRDSLMEIFFFFSYVFGLGGLFYLVLDSALQKDYSRREDRRQKAFSILRR